MDGPHQVEREEADGSGVGIDGDALTVVVAEDVSQLARDAAEQVTVAFAFGDDVVDVAVYEGVIVIGVELF